MQDENKTATLKMKEFVGDLVGPKRLLDTLKLSEFMDDEAYLPFEKELQETKDLMLKIIHMEASPDTDGVLKEVLTSVMDNAFESIFKD
jgi:hypothetical protein